MFSNLCLIMFEFLRIKSNILSWSFTPATSSTARFRVATFNIALSISKLERELKAGLVATGLTVGTDFSGSTTLADSTDNAEVEYGRSIIAVVGPASHTFESWKEEGKPNMWLRDLFARATPKARNITYDYNTKLLDSQFDATIPELSRGLLEMIKYSRSGQVIYEEFRKSFKLIQNASEEKHSLMF
ncbi:hypothetical protein ETB97_007720 [Aspergillus alliaceus]|uniref:Uncharacterized protein n=1 Tax=Petromyces alliaceus TaxID=209559 RepID=A0A8H5ZSU4_PETAA|nr:hypothetical protein ETB97_007720 [Aspergillus burnettii]